MHTITGHYSAHGYLVQLDGETIYRAGNHSQESSEFSHAEPGSAFALPLRTLKKFCIQTAREMAGEHRATYYRVFRARNLEDLQ